ncbi:MAG: DUF5660 family protein [Patescibacteria group bacterium]
MDKAFKTKSTKSMRSTNVVESLKDIGSGTFDSFKNDLIGSGSNEFFDQIFGKYPNKKYSGEITPGESVEMNDVFSGKREKEEKLQKQLIFERRIREEDKFQLEKKSNELRLQLSAITQEVISIARATPQLSRELQIASLEAPVDPGIYHLIFFEKLLEFLKGFRKKIESASVWLNAVNSKAMKKNYWGLYKKHGGKFLLSPDHFLQRSAG